MFFSFGRRVPGSPSLNQSHRPSCHQSTTRPARHHGPVDQSIPQGSGPSSLPCRYVPQPRLIPQAKKFFFGRLSKADKGPQLLVRPYDPAWREERPLYFPHSPLFGSAGALGTSAPRIRTRTRNRLRPELPESTSPLNPLTTLPISGLRPLGRVRFRTLPPYLANVTSRNGDRHSIVRKVRATR
jgi:hypothetical protein